MGGMRNPWEWKKGNNPYKRNAFTLTGASPGDSLKIINQKGEITKRLIIRAPENKKPKVFGRPVEEADVAVASQILSSPNERMLEELLCHRPHSLDLARFEEHTAYFSRLPVPPVKEGVLPQITNLNALCAFLPKPKPGKLPPILFPPALGHKKAMYDEIVFRI